MRSKRDILWFLAATICATNIGNSGRAAEDSTEPPSAIRRCWQMEWERAQAEIDRLAAEPVDTEPYRDPHILDEQALIRPSDRDPLDVALRRALALAADLQPIIDSPDFADVATELKTLQVQAAKLDPETPDGQTRRKAIYDDVRKLRRRIALSNPLVDFDEILLTTGRPGGAHIQSHFYGRKAKPNRLLSLTGFKNGLPQMKELLKGVRVTGGRNDGQVLAGGQIYTLDLSWDGKELLFDYCACIPPADYGEDSVFNPSHMTPDMTYNIYKLNLETMELRQLTDTMYNDSCPAWLPDGRIVFISDRRRCYVRCHPYGPPDKPFNRRTVHQPCATMHSMAADGSDVIPISWHETSETFPRVTNDGRIVYTRWDYVDREFHVGHHIWFCMPDGRDPRGPHGNYPFPHSTIATDTEFYNSKSKGYIDGRHLRPWAEYCIRPIPESKKYIAVAGVHHSQPSGRLILIDPTVPDDGKMSQVRKITPGILPREGRNGHKELPYSWPYALSEDYYLVRDERGSLTLLDRFGNSDVLFHGQALLAIPRTSRSRPPVIPTQTYQGQRAGLSGRKPATISVMNVYESDFDWPKDTKITALRVVQIFPRPWSSPFNNVGQSYMNGTINRMSLGTVPVEDDGSAHFEAPVECEIYFQALDERGLAVQSMRSGTYVHPGEQLSCIGCHEDKWRADRPKLDPLALRRPPSKLEPEVGGLEPVNFYRLVKPVLDAKCLPCHREEKKGLLTSDYRKLEPYAFYLHGSGQGLLPKHGGSRSTPGNLGARASVLGKTILDERHQKHLQEGKFTEEDFRRICLWLDLNSMEFGSSSLDPEDQAKQRGGEIVWPKLDFDPANRQRTEHRETPTAKRSQNGTKYTYRWRVPLRPMR